MARFARSPDRIGGEEVRTYLLCLVRERKLAWSVDKKALFALRFCTESRRGGPRHPRAESKASHTAAVSDQQPIRENIHIGHCGPPSPLDYQRKQQRQQRAARRGGVAAEVITRLGLVSRESAL